MALRRRSWLQGAFQIEGIAEPNATVSVHRGVLLSAREFVANISLRYYSSTSKSFPCDQEHRVWLFARTKYHLLLFPILIMTPHDSRSPSPRNHGRGSSYYQNDHCASDRAEVGSLGSSRRGERLLNADGVRNGRSRRDNPPMSARPEFGNHGEWANENDTQGEQRRDMRHMHDTYRTDTRRESANRVCMSCVLYNIGPYADFKAVAASF